MAGLSGCSTHALCLAFLWQIFLLPKGTKETGFNCKDFSVLTGLADNLERKGSGDKAGLVSPSCAVLILSKSITFPLSSVTFAVVLSPSFHHTPVCASLPPCVVLLAALFLLLAHITVTSIFPLLSISHISLSFTSPVFWPHLESPNMEMTLIL